MLAPGSEKDASGGTSGGIWRKLRAVLQLQKLPGGENVADAHVSKEAYHLCRKVAAAVMLMASLAMLLYAEIAHGWTEALFLKVKQNAIQTTSCAPPGRK
jgi:hypothetical protein